MNRAMLLGLLMMIALTGCKKQDQTATMHPAQGSMETLAPPADEGAGAAAAPATIEPTPPAAENVTAAPAAAGNTYVVQKGDTLWSIAQKRLGNGRRWREIVDLNPGIEPTKLHVGQTLQMPAH